jgi:hypothetical protein
MKTLPVNVTSAFLGVVEMTRRLESKPSSDSGGGAALNSYNTNMRAYTAGSSFTLSFPFWADLWPQTQCYRWAARHRTPLTLCSAAHSSHSHRPYADKDAGHARRPGVVASSPGTAEARAVDTLEPSSRRPSRRGGIIMMDTLEPSSRLMRVAIKWSSVASSL